MRNLTKTSALLIAVVLVLSCAQQGHATLAAVGPVDPANGFPQFYTARGLSLAPCLDVFDAVAVSAGCVPFDPEPGIFDPAARVVFPANFPSEFFYWFAEAAFDPVTDPGGNVRQIRFALEGAFAGVNPLPGTQIVFARKRFRVLVPVGGTIAITHPYGTDTFTDGVAPDRLADGEINVTVDEPLAGIPLDFTSVLANTLIGPSLLRWDATAPAPPAGYIGDFMVGHTVTGGRGRNNVTIRGSGLNISTNLWFVAGKISARLAPVAPAPGVPGADSITITRAMFASRLGTWSIVGRGTVPGNTVTVALGANTVGTATVGPTGIWRVLIRRSPLPAVAGNSIVATSNGGGSQTRAVLVR